MAIDLAHEPLRPGPVNQSFAVVDYDATNDCFYPPVDLDEPSIVMRQGLDPDESDPRFHQQMVYAVVAETISRFEFALGRPAKWNRNATRHHRRLLVLPHAMHAANAFYSRDLGALAFGYFRAAEDDAGANLPGQTVFTCLSHDIIAHETTHALVDGQREFYIEQTGEDTPAFHEAFADVVALLQHFTYRDALLDVIRRTGGLLYRPELAAEVAPGSHGALIGAELTASNPLVQLARQFGEAMGMRKALRSALGTRPDPKALAHLSEPHARGAVLVAAVFDAFFSVYVQRTRDLMRIGRANGTLNSGDVHPDLAARLATEAMKAAEHVGNICIRALDYCPPIDLRFGDFLRAMITADQDLVPADPHGYRQALIDAFRSRGIYPTGAASFSEQSLRWRPPDGPPLRIEGLSFDPFREPAREVNARNARLLVDFARANANALGLHEDTQRFPVSAHAFRPICRIRPDGRVKLEAMAEVMQRRDDVPLTPRDPASPAFTFRGGSTLILDQAGEVLYAVWKPLGEDDASNSRLARQRAYFTHLDNEYALASYQTGPWMPGQSPRPLSVLDSADGTLPMRFDLLHQGL